MMDFYTNGAVISMSLEQGQVFTAMTSRWNNGRMLHIQVAFLSLERSEDPASIKMLCIFYQDGLLPGGPMLMKPGVLT